MDERACVLHAFVLLTLSMDATRAPLRRGLDGPLALTRKQANVTVAKFFQIPENQESHIVSLVETSGQLQIRGPRLKMCIWEICGCCMPRLFNLTRWSL